MEIIFNTLELSYKRLPMKDKKQMRSALWFSKLSALRGASWRRENSGKNQLTLQLEKMSS